MPIGVGSHASLFLKKPVKVIAACFLRPEFVDIY
jgi:hypothetical protein